MLPSQRRRLHARLCKQIRYHAKLYYVESMPEISDYEFDVMYERLEKLEAEYPELVMSDSPTQRVECWI